MVWEDIVKADREDRKSLKGPIEIVKWAFEKYELISSMVLARVNSFALAS